MEEAGLVVVVGVGTNIQGLHQVGRQAAAHRARRLPDPVVEQIKARAGAPDQDGVPGVVPAGGLGPAGAERRVALLEMDPGVGGGMEVVARGTRAPGEAGVHRVGGRGLDDQEQRRVGRGAQGGARHAAAVEPVIAVELHRRTSVEGHGLPVRLHRRVGLRDIETPSRTVPPQAEGRAIDQSRHGTGLETQPQALRGHGGLEGQPAVEYYESRQHRQPSRPPEDRIRASPVPARQGGLHRNIHAPPPQHEHVFEIHRLYELSVVR